MDGKILFEDGRLFDGMMCRGMRERMCMCMCMPGYSEKRRRLP